MSLPAYEASAQPATIIPFNDQIVDVIAFREFIPEVNQKEQALRFLAEQLGLLPSDGKEQIISVLNNIGKKHGYISINSVLDYLCFRVNTNGVIITDIEFCDDGDDLEM